MTVETLHFYGDPKPNSFKAEALLEALGVKYEYHEIDLNNGEHKQPEHLARNPNGRIPALIDPNFKGTDGKDLRVFESGAILLHLARNYDKEHKFYPEDPAKRAEVDSWLMFQMAGIGPIFGQAMWFQYLDEDKNQTRAIERYRNETHRLLSVIEGHLSGKLDGSNTERHWLAANQCSLAEFAAAFWVLCSPPATHNENVLKEYPHAAKWVERSLEAFKSPAPFQEKIQHFKQAFSKFTGITLH